VNLILNFWLSEVFRMNVSAKIFQQNKMKWRSHDCVQVSPIKVPVVLNPNGSDLLTSLNLGPSAHTMQLHSFNLIYAHLKRFSHEIET
jgi:hypothetical protein